MKWFLFFWLIIACSCGCHSSAGLSNDQQGLLMLSENFKKDYQETRDTISRQKLVNEYELRLQDYLRHSCDSALENMRVRVTKIEEDAKGKVMAEFNDKNCRYVFRKTYSSTKDMKADTVYQLVKSLKPNTDIKLHFLFTGNLKIRDAVDPGVENFEIEVIPMALMNGA